MICVIAVIRSFCRWAPQVQGIAQPMGELYRTSLEQPKATTKEAQATRGLQVL